MQAPKFYVVWKGYAPGVYDSWEEAELQVSGYPDAQYRSFKTMEAAVEAFREGFDKQSLINEVNREIKRLSDEGTVVEYKEEAPAQASTKAPAATPVRTIVTPYATEAIAVDAACSGNPGPMEYRGVYLRTGQELFHVGPMEGGTNNIGEFLALVHGLALLDKQGLNIPIYSDSVNAQGWIRQGICKTTLMETEVNRPIFDLIRRAESWIRTHRVTVPIIKWNTKEWGEIPADFGRK